MEGQSSWLSKCLNRADESTLIGFLDKGSWNKGSLPDYFFFL